MQEKALKMLKGLVGDWRQARKRNKKNQFGRGRESRLLRRHFFPSMSDCSGVVVPGRGGSVA